MKSANNNFLDLFRAIGRHEYIIHHKDYLDSIDNNPVLKNIWSTGPWFCFLANISTKKIEMVLGQSEKVLGFTSQEIIRKNERFVEEMIHPDDFPFVIQVIQQAIGYIMQAPEEEKEGVYVVFQHRAIKKSGEVITAQNQNIPLLFDEHRFPFLFANIITDISHLSVASIPQATLINKKKDEFFNLSPNNTDLHGNKGLFSDREKEIIRLLIKGYDSRKIAGELHLSYETVRTHRKNILRKAGLHNTVELISQLSNQQWLT